MENKGNNERFEFINELLTGEELLERLAAAQDVIRGLTANGKASERKIEGLRGEIKKLNEILDSITIQQRDIARDLASAGGQTHKDKDEVLLIAIYRLLSIGYAPVKVRDMDDIPWNDDLPF